MSQEELDRLLDQPPSLTKRVTAPSLEKILYQAFPVLDHGFVRVIDYMGDESAIVQAARVSYGAGTRSVSDDRGLIRYLISHRHSTPLEMCEIKLHVKLPIFVARQWIRHRMASVNEISARYSILDREFYTPSREDLGIQAKSNKQGREGTLSAEEAANVRSLLIDSSLKAYETYESLLNDEGDGTPVRPEDPQVARELARMGLSLNYYTQWYWKIDLHNLLHFLSLRMDPHAQLEFRRYASLIGGFVESWLPNVWQAFRDYRLNAATFSAPELEVLRQVLDIFDDGGGLAEADSRADFWKDPRASFRRIFDRVGLDNHRERAEFLRKIGVKLPPSG